VIELGETLGDGVGVERVGDHGTDDDEAMAGEEMSMDLCSDYHMR
jgi:hypothetical protein